MMKKMIAAALAALLVLALAACGNGKANTESSSAPARASAPAGTASQPAGTPASAETPAPSADASSQPAESGSASSPAADHAAVLVAFFSATGTTKGVAEKIAAITGGDLYEIVPAEPYSSADLNWNDRKSRSTREQNDKSARPAIGSDPLDLTGYETVYLGFPIWWGEEPRIMDTFVEAHDFSGITVIPFCTSSSSGIGRSGPNMEALAGTGRWLDGKRVGGNVSEADLRTWIESLK